MKEKVKKRMKGINVGRNTQRNEVKKRKKGKRAHLIL
jgi:hypothetical protein